VVGTISTAKKKNTESVQQASPKEEQTSKHKLLANLSERIQQKVKIGRVLQIELAVTVLAFVSMAVLSYVFLSSTAKASLIRNADTVLDLTEARIDSSLQEYETMIESYSEELSELLTRGADEEALMAYIDELSEIVSLETHSMFGIVDFFGYFETLPGEPLLMHNYELADASLHKSEEQDWYKAAIDAGGGVAETIPYIDSGGRTIYTYVKCLLDDQGQRLGIACMSVAIESTGQSVVETALNQGGYGMLLNQDGMILFHPNPGFRGMSIREPSIPLSSLADEIISGSVFEQPMLSYKGEASIAFFRTLHNGWHLGLVTPENQYYESISRMGVIIAALASILAVILIGFLIRLDSMRAKSDEESRQKSMFLANMSHEIRTPINAIVGMTAIGRSVGSLDRKDYCFSKIDDASRHLLGVIDNILDISKIEANKIELSPTNFSFERMLQQTVNIINFRVDEKKQKLTVYIDRDIPRVLYADDQRLAQVITNLLSNAVKFTPEEGEISLDARLVSEKDGVYTIKIEVKDSGIGITAEQQKRLFQNFQQAESSTTRKYGGTGLGLVIARSIVELMGGNLWLDSDIGKGSTFSFTIDVVRGDETKYGLTSRDLNWGNVRILTIDDDQYILEYFKDIVLGFGASCEVAEGAEEALQLVDESGDFNIYFIDLRMPGVDGIELTREIKAREKKPGHSVVIMISSADLSSVEAEAREAGVDKFLLKPIFPSAIADVISECIGIVNEKESEAPLNIDGIFSGKRLLFAEDIEINREILITLLEPSQIAIECAVNGLEAVNMFAESPERYDVILMDVQMPEMDGLDATRQIRMLDLPNAASIPIIAMTANVFKEDIDDCLAAGMNGHVGKPLDLEKLVTAINECLAV
jgi:signal transduction histidine kinase/DNA-binding response OmpR family regulator